MSITLEQRIDDLRHRGCGDCQHNRDLDALLAERDAAQTALGLASEEVRALRAARCWNCDAPRIDPDAPERTEP